MSEQHPDEAPPAAATASTPEPIDPEVVEPEVVEGEANAAMPPGSISQPAKVMRIGSMIKQLLEEVRATELDEKGRHRLREIYDTSVAELSGALSSDLQEELHLLARPFDSEVPSESELQIAQAQLVGWLEGLFHGIQATLFAQQAAAQQQLEQMNGQALPAGGPQPQSGVYL